jgi:uncharacterized membrane protein
MEHIKNPVEYTGAQLARMGHTISSAYHSLQHIQERIHSPAPAIRRIGLSDLRDAVRKGIEDFGEYRTDVIFLCVFYPVMGLILARFIFGMDMLPLLFPLASGFTILGPLAAVGLYEMSRLREQGNRATWANAFDVIRAPGFGAIVVLGMALVAIFLLWLAAAWIIFENTLGPEPPASIAAFIHDTFMTEAGWTMIVVGTGVGFLFALLAMTISIVSFPLLLDRDVGLDTAIKTSVRAVLANPLPMAVWGLFVAVALAVGSIPLFVGLIVVLPILGHSTWHLYRKLVA